MELIDVGIPSIDLSQFVQKDATEKASFVHSIGTAFEDIGFVAVHNHGISESLIHDLYTQVEHFFELPKAVKRRYEFEELKGQRGYISFGKEHAKNSNTGDLKEFWHFGQELNQEVNHRSFNYPANITCQEVPSFNSAGMLAYRALEDLGRKLLKAIALYLDLDENYFEQFVVNGNSILRPIHYPPIISEPKSAVRAGEHEDINLITLLIGASADGLQVKNKQGNWISVTALPEHIVVNVGDMLQRLTNNKLKSTTHRVVNPPKEKWSSSRYSIPFFLHPVSNMPLNCLPDCIQKSEKQYEDISAGAFLMQRLKEIGLA
jgi:isopenicillin N synthase-like dioxygenase